MARDRSFRYRGRRHLARPVQVGQEPSVGILDLGRIVVELGSSLIDAAQNAVLEAQTELAGQYTVARTNIIVAESMIRAAADQPKEQAKKTIAAAMSIIEDTEESLIGRVSAIGFNVREDIRKLFSAARQVSKAILELPSTIGSGFGLSFGVMALGGLGLLGLAWAVSRRT